MNQPYLSIIIPAYNEEKRLDKTFLELEGFLVNQKYTYELIFVIDGSTDKTREIIEKFIFNKPDCTLLSFDENRGKGFAIKEGMLKANGEFVLFTDVDLSTPIQELNKLLEHIKSNEIVIGSRYMDSYSIKLKQPFFRRIISRLGNLLIRSVLGLNIKDTQCGFKLFQHDAAKRIFSNTSINRWGFDIEALAIAKKFRFKIKEVAVNWFDDKDSKLRAGKAALGTLKELLRIKYNLITKKYN